MRGSVLAAFGAALALLVTAGLTVNLGVLPLQFEEPRRTLVALEMLLRGDYVVLTTHGELYFNKPPLFNWVLIALLRLFGSGEAWVFRLATVASMLGLGLALWCVGRRHLGRPTALRATAFLLTFTTLLFYGSLYAEPDVFFALLVALQALAIFAFEQAGRPLALFVASYLLAALGVLTKGLPSIVFQGLTLAAWLPLAGRRRWLLSLPHLAGLAAFTICAGGYFAVYSLHQDPLPFLVKLVFESTDRTVAAPRVGPGAIVAQLAGFPLQLAALCAPWVVFAPGLLGREARARVRATPFLRFCLVFLAANVLPYWLSPGNRPRYMFPFLPFLAALLAVGSEQLAERGGYARVLRWVLGVALSAAPLAMLCFPFLDLQGARASPLWLWLLAAGLLGALAVGYWRAGQGWARVALLVLAVATARIGYDLVVPQYRREHGDARFLEEVVATLNREYRDRPVELLSERRTRIKSLPLVERTFDFSEWQPLPFTIPYHYALGRGELLRFADRMEPGKLYLARARLPVDQPHEVVRLFDVGGDKGEDLKLVRLRE